MDQDILKKIEEIVDAPGCYPESARKPRDLRLREMTDWYDKYNEVNKGAIRILIAPSTFHLI